MTKNWFAPPLPRVLAHRGLATDAPENTRLAFFTALAAGAIYLETDVHASRDGVAVLSHDPDLARLTGADRKVSDLSIDELRALDLGRGEGFSTLQETLESFPDARFNLDIKSADAVQPAIQAISAAGAADRVLIGSFSGKRSAPVVRALPGVATSASSVRFAVALVLAKLGLTPLVRVVLKRVDAVQVPTRAAGFTIASAPLVARLHRSGVEVHFWTINDPVEMELLLDMGADAIITDHADVALSLVKRRSSGIGGAGNSL